MNFPKAADLRSKQTAIGSKLTEDTFNQIVDYILEILNERLDTFPFFSMTISLLKYRECTPKMRTELKTKLTHSLTLRDFEVDCKDFDLTLHWSSESDWIHWISSLNFAADENKGGEVVALSDKKLTFDGLYATKVRNLQKDMHTKAVMKEMQQCAHRCTETLRNASSNETQECIFDIQGDETLMYPSLISSRIIKDLKDNGYIVTEKVPNKSLIISWTEMESDGSVTETEDKNSETSQQIQQDIDKQDRSLQKELLRWCEAEFGQSLEIKDGPDGSKKNKEAFLEAEMMNFSSAALLFSLLFASKSLSRNESSQADKQKVFLITVECLRRMKKNGF